MVERLNPDHQKQLHNIDDDLGKIKKNDAPEKTKDVIKKDVERLENILSEMPSEVPEEVKGALNSCLFSLKDAVGGDGENVDFDKIDEAETTLRQAIQEE